MIKNFDNYTYTTDGKTYVKAVSHYAGDVVIGKAYCSPEDSFDFRIGAKLAAARCNLAVAKKRLQRSKNKYSYSVSHLQDAQEYCEKMADYTATAAECYVQAWNLVNSLKF